MNDAKVRKYTEWLKNNREIQEPKRELKWKKVSKKRDSPQFFNKPEAKLTHKQAENEKTQIG